MNMTNLEAAKMLVLAEARGRLVEGQDWGRVLYGVLWDLRQSLWDELEDTK